MKIRSKRRVYGKKAVTLVKYDVTHDTVYEVWSDGSRTILPCTVEAFLARAQEMLDAKVKPATPIQTY